MNGRVAGSAAARPRVLVCDDSRTYAAALARALAHGGELDVVGVCHSAEEAIAALARVEPDVLTMDLELPGMSGMDAVEEIMSSRPTPILVLSAHVRERSVNAGAALAAGALDALGKDGLDLRDPDSPTARALRSRLGVLSGARVIRHPRARLRRSPRRPAPTRTAAAIGVCASTGGPQALAQLLGDLPEDFRVPVLVVQHIAPGFVDGLARWLDSTVKLPVRLARDAAEATPGIWIAPEGAHLVIRPSGRLALDRGDHGPLLHRPSADVLLRSLAAGLGAGAVAVVLTGMGRDGADGVRAVRAAGGLTIAQDEESSAVFGMPKAAVESGAEVVLPLPEIAPMLAPLAPAEPPR